MYPHAHQHWIHGYIAHRMCLLCRFVMSVDFVTCQIAMPHGRYAKQASSNDINGTAESPQLCKQRRFAVGPLDLLVLWMAGVFHWRPYQRLYDITFNGNMMQNYYNYGYCLLSCTFTRLRGLDSISIWMWYLLSHRALGLALSIRRYWIGTTWRRRYYPVSGYFQRKTGRWIISRIVLVTLMYHHHRR
jgi:hypothetical protein